MECVGNEDEGEVGKTIVMADVKSATLELPRLRHRKAILAGYGIVRAPGRGLGLMGPQLMPRPSKKAGDEGNGLDIVHQSREEYGYRRKDVASHYIIIG